MCFLLLNTWFYGIDFPSGIVGDWGAVDTRLSTCPSSKLIELERDVTTFVCENYNSFLMKIKFSLYITGKYYLNIFIGTIDLIFQWFIGFGFFHLIYFWCYATGESTKNGCSLFSSCWQCWCSYLITINKIFIFFISTWPIKWNVVIHLHWAFFHIF